jgi:hypothetical protein
MLIMTHIMNVGDQMIFYFTWIITSKAPFELKAIYHQFKLSQVKLS